jgi:hypothetical protein
VAEGIDAKDVIYTHYVEFLVSQSEQPKTRSGQPAGFDTASKWGIVGAAKGDVGHEFRHEIRKLKKGDEICINALTGYHIITSERTGLIEAALRGVQVKIIVADVFTANVGRLWKFPLLQDSDPEIFKSALQQALLNLLKEFRNRFDNEQNLRQLHGNFQIRLAKTIIPAHTVILRYEDGRQKSLCYYSPYFPYSGTEGFATFLFEDTADRETSLYVRMSKSFDSLWDESESVIWDTAAFRIRAEEPEDMKRADSEGFLTIADIS